MCLPFLTCNLSRDVHGSTNSNGQLFSFNVLVPPDNTCSRLPPVANGGIIYSDLNLAPGTTGRYICDAGFMLHGQHEFVCTEDGVWDGHVIEVQVSCKCKNKIENIFAPQIRLLERIFREMTPLCFPI